MLKLILYVIYIVLTIVSVFIAYKLMFAFKHFKMERLISERSMIDDLPSVSVCIPARNETHAMTQCLERVIASTYPKLEIIVLDDSSGDNTSILIKSFAHVGVRFVEGLPLTDGWLGKNHALQGLLDESSGSLILYMDVDTLIGPDSIEQLVSYMSQEKAAMISVLPRRQDGLRSSMLFSTLRYLWELILHRRAAPAVASSAWMIHRDVLVNEFNGFSQYQTDIQPEARLAARLMRQNRYRFLIGTPLLGVSYEKRWKSQVDTSIRLLFPLLGRSVFRSIIALGILLCLILPIFVLLYAVIDGWSLIQTVALWQLCVNVALYGSYLEKVWSRGWWIGSLLWPIVIAQEIIILIASIYRYKTNTVSWKGRPVTLKDK